MLSSQSYMNVGHYPRQPLNVAIARAFACIAIAVSLPSLKIRSFAAASAGYTTRKP